jgi:dUTP pyrophosphatase
MTLIPFKADEKHARQLTKAHDDDAAYDLCALCHETLMPGDRCLVPTGLRMAIPDGHVGLVCPRSGLASKRGVTVLNAPGVIDPGYRGDVGVVLINLGDQPVRIQSGDAIAQLLILQTAKAVFVPGDLAESVRGDLGFGSSG